MVVSNIFFDPYLKKWSILTNNIQSGQQKLDAWHAQLISQRQFPWYLAPGQVLLLHVWGISGKKTPGNGGRRRLRKEYICKKVTKYLCCRGTHTQWTPKKGRFQVSFKDEILESHLKHCTCKKKRPSPSHPTRSFFSLAGVSSMATPWTFASAWGGEFNLLALHPETPEGIWLRGWCRLIFV